MMTVKSISYLILIGIVCFIFASDDPVAIKLIEGSTAGIIGSILGGITAGISIIFGILSALKIANPQVVKNSQSFNKFIDNLKFDIMILICCLVLSILLPYFRVVGAPLISMPIGEYIPSVGRLITGLELMTITISMFALVEVITVMFKLFKMSMSETNQINEKVNN